MKSIIAAIALATAAADAHAAPSLFGVTLGETINLPTCPTDAVPTADCKSDFLVGEDGTAHGVVQIMNKPPWMMLGLMVDLKNDHVERIYVRTGGVEFNDDILQALIKRFGRPTQRGEPVFQNGFGVKYRGMAAKWLLPDGQVFADTVFDGDPELGEIEIVTKAPADKQQSARERPL